MTRKNLRPRLVRAGPDDQVAHPTKDRRNLFLPQSRLEIKIHPEIGRVCLQAGKGKDLAYRLWVLFRASDRTGRDWVGIAQGREAARDIGVTPRQFVKHLLIGEGVFWTTWGGRVRLPAWQEMRSIARRAPQMLSVNQS